MNYGTYNRVRKRYIEEEVKNASPAKLILMIYDLVIASLKKGDTSKARAGIRELIDSLDFEKGGALAMNLLSLYEYALRKIHEGNLDEAIEVIKPLRDTWEEAFFKKNLEKISGEASGGES